MLIQREFKGRDYKLGNWMRNLLLAANEDVEFQESFSLESDSILTLRDDNVNIRKLIKKAYKEMQKGNI